MVTVMESTGTLRLERRLAHPPERVWAAITEPEQVREWMRAKRATIEPRRGGTIDIDSVIHITGRILVWDPPRVLEHEFRIQPGPRLPDGENAVLRYDLEPDGDGSLVTRTFTRLSPESARLFANGQRIILDLLARYLDAAARKGAA